MKQFAAAVMFVASALLAGCSRDQDEVPVRAVAAPAPSSAESVPTQEAKPPTFADAVDAAASRARTATFKSCVANEVAFWGEPGAGTADETFGAKCQDLPLAECVNDLARGYREAAGDRETFVSLEQIEEWESACGEALGVDARADANAGGPATKAPTTPRARFMWQLKENIAQIESLQSATPISKVYSPENDGVRDGAFAIDQDLLELARLAQISDRCIDTISRYRNPVEDVVFHAWRIATVDSRAPDLKVLEDSRRGIESAYDNLDEWCSDADISALRDMGGEVIESIAQGVRVATDRIAGEKQIAADRQQIADREVAQRVEAIRTGQAEPESFKEASAALNAQSGLNVVYTPLVTPDQRAVMISASLDSVKEGLLIAKAGDFYFAVAIPPGSRAARQAGGLRHRGTFHVVGRYIDNMEYQTVMGQTKIMPVFSSVWLGDGAMQF